MIRQPNPEILKRFTGDGETWEAMIDRVSSICGPRHADACREIIAEGVLVPGGQILRGAGHCAAVLYNCFVTGVGPDENAADVAARITAWTRRGAGVGVNLDDLAERTRAAGGRVCDIINEIAKSQHGLWLEGITRTATMVTLSLADPEAATVSRTLAGGECYRHLNLGILVTDDDLSARPAMLQPLAQALWETGNPSFLFVDRIREDHPFPDPVRACNPCGEQFLADEEGCNLASLNLAALVTANKFDWPAFRQAFDLAVRFLDNIIDASDLPSIESRIIAHRRRRIGLGVLGFASALNMLDMRYGSSESIEFASMLAAELRTTAQAASEALAHERGAFPDSPDGKRRNSHLLSIAPTGAISLLWRVSSGIEPFFGEVIAKETLIVDFGTSGAARPLRGSEVPAIEHLAILSAWQRHVDGGISKTINLLETASPGDIRTAVESARRAGCKGISLFRENSRVGAITRCEAVVV